MSSESKKKRGISGLANAKAQPYRLIGGSHESPILTEPCAALARKSQASDFRRTATYATGIQGGLLAQALGFPANINLADLGL